MPRVTALIDQDTLAGWRDEFLAELEGWFGPRDKSYGLGAIVPALPNRLPNIYLDLHFNRIDIRITPRALAGAQGKLLAKWQVAHECVHLIDPNFSPPTNILEEGIATWYQNEKIRPTCFDSRPSYQEAEALVRPHMVNGHLPKIIRRLRLRPLDSVRICEITTELLAQHAPKVPVAAAARLCSRFGS